MRQQEGSRDSTRQYVPVHGKDLDGAPVGAHGEHPGHEVNGHLLRPCRQERTLFAPARPCSLLLAPARPYLPLFAPVCPCSPLLLCGVGRIDSGVRKGARRIALRKRVLTLPVLWPKNATSPHLQRLRYAFPNFNTRSYSF